MQHKSQTFDHTRAEHKNKDYSLPPGKLLFSQCISWVNNFDFFSELGKSCFPLKTDA